MKWAGPVSMLARVVAVVEDDPLQLDAVQQLLEHEGLDAVTYLEVPSVDSVARLRMPDVVLLDAHLADTSGADTVRAALDAWPGVPVVIWTGDDSPGLRSSCLAAGCDDVVVKGSIGDERLIQRIHDAHARRLGHQARCSSDAVASARLAVQAARAVRPTLEEMLRIGPLVRPHFAEEG